MKFDHSKLSLPFHPGDPLFWVDEEDGFKVKRQNGGIRGVLLTKDEILLIEADSNEPSEPNTTAYNWLSEKGAEKFAKNLRNRGPQIVHGRYEKWLDVEKWRPDPEETYSDVIALYQDKSIQFIPRTDFTPEYAKEHGIVAWKADKYPFKGGVEHDN